MVTSFTGSGGNPLLKPMEANQFDAAIEWYFAPQGSLYSTLFYKDLKNYLIRGSQVQNLFGRDWEVDTTVNGDKGTVKGFEIGYSQFYDELPGWLRGLGMQANFTYVDSKGGSPTPVLPGIRPRCRRDCRSRVCRRRATTWSVFTSADLWRPASPTTGASAGC